MKLNRTHTARNSSREIPRYIFTVIIIFLLNIFFFYFFKVLYYALIFILITHYNLAKKKDPIFKANFIYIS